MEQLYFVANGSVIEAWHGDPLEPEPGDKLGDMSLWEALAAVRNISLAAADATKNGATA
ncbi:hypothetical protein ACRQEJ_07265 [Actinotignum sp. GS-2025b]